MASERPVENNNILLSYRVRKSGGWEGRDFVTVYISHSLDLIEVL